MSNKKKTKKKINDGIDKSIDHMLTTSQSAKSTVNHLMSSFGRTSIPKNLRHHLTSLLPSTRKTQSEPTSLDNSASSNSDDPELSPFTKDEDTATTTQKHLLKIAIDSKTQETKTRLEHLIKKTMDEKTQLAKEREHLKESLADAEHAKRKWTKHDEQLQDQIRQHQEWIVLGQQYAHEREIQKSEKDTLRNLQQKLMHQEEQHQLKVQRLAKDKDELERRLVECEQKRALDKEHEATQTQKLADAFAQHHALTQQMLVEKQQLFEHREKEIQHYSAFVAEQRRWETVKQRDMKQNELLRARLADELKKIANWKVKWCADHTHRVDTQTELQKAIGELESIRDALQNEVSTLLLETSKEKDDKDELLVYVVPTPTMVIKPVSMV